MQIGPMRWIVVTDRAELADVAARLVLRQVGEHPDSVLGLPTGGTPQGMYERLVAICRRERHCFARAVSFNLDEYVGLPPEHPGSYAAYMERHLFRHVDLPPENRHLPDGTAGRVRREQPELGLEEALARECRRYEEEIAAAGGLDLTLLGLGHNGHVAFNEPGSAVSSRTRVVTLDEGTREANARFFGSLDQVPRRAITMGIATLLASRRLVLLAAGDGKADAVERLATSQPDPSFPASFLHRHSDVTAIVDAAAARRLPAELAADAG